jgi:hypothetical protein
MQPLVVGDGAPVYAGTFRDNLRSCLAEHSAALSGYNELHVQLIASDGPRASISVVCIEQRGEVGGEVAVCEECRAMGALQPV